MATTPEGKLKKEVKAYLKKKGAWFYMPVQNGMGEVGIPDIVGCYRGLFFAIETKAPTKVRVRTDEQLWAKATPNQQNKIRAIQDAEGQALVVDRLSQVEDMCTVMDVSAELMGR